MPKLMFEADTHEELLAQAKAWVESAEQEQDGQLTPSQAIEQGAELTKDALRIIAKSAPSPVAENEVFQALNEMGYKATDATKFALIDGLDKIDEMTGGSVVRQVRQRGRAAFYEMNAVVAKQVLKTIVDPGTEKIDD